MPFASVRIPRRWRSPLWAISIGLLAAALTLTLPNLGASPRDDKPSLLQTYLAIADGIAYDYLFFGRGPEKPLPVRANQPQWPIPEIVIVEITQAAYANLVQESGAHPGHDARTIPRSLHARVLRELHKAGASVIGIDLAFLYETDPKEDREFARAMADCGNVVIGTVFTPVHPDDFIGTTNGFPPIAFLNSARAFGPFDIPLDSDMTARRFDPTSRRIDWKEVTEEEDYPVFGAQVAAAYLGLSQEELKQQLTQGRFGDYRFKYAPESMESNTDSRRVRICYAGFPHDSCRYVDYDTVLIGGYPPGIFQDKIVLIGDTTTLGKDSFRTPMFQNNADRPGVEVQASIIHTLLSGHYYATFPERGRIALVWLCALVASLITLRFRPVGAILPMTLFLAFLAFCTWRLFDTYLVLRPTQIFLSTGLSFGLQTIYYYRIEKRRADWIRREFGKYLGPRVSEKVLDPDWNPYSEEKYFVTVMFTDLQGFTSLSENMSPSETVVLLNQYLRDMVRLINKYQGSLDKIMGDGIMAYFNAPDPVPDHERNAVLCAIEMQQVMQAWRSISEEAGVPPLKVRIGIHSGEAIVGHIGAQQVGYTAIGDTVNTAARLEPLNKELGTEILVSEAVKEKLPDTMPAQFMGEFTLRGKEDALRVYSIPADYAP